LEKQQEELQLRKVQEESRQTALEHLERFCGEVATGLSNLTFEERQQLLRPVVERVIVKDDSVRIETLIPSDRQRAGLLRTRHPELDSGSTSRIERPLQLSQPLSCPDNAWVEVQRGMRRNYCSRPTFFTACTVRDPVDIQQETDILRCHPRQQNVVPRKGAATRRSQQRRNQRDPYPLP